MPQLLTSASSAGRSYPRVFATVLLGALILPSVQPVQADGLDGIRPLEEFSPGFLGMYRKVMEIEDEIGRHAETYGVDMTLARALCIQESGGNANLNSWAGANGYFQVMPATFRSLGVETNIEAGIKYLSQMIRRFGRGDYAIGAYNGGPGRIVRGRPPLETLQYILFVGQYRNVLKVYESSVRHHATQLRLESVREGDSWWSLSQRLGVSVLQLRVHNPFLATRALHVGQLIAHPPAPRTDLFVPVDDDLEYVTRHGDNYLMLSFVLGVNRNAMRAANDLWHLQTLPPNQVLRVPLAWEGKYNEHEVQVGDDLQTVATAMKSQPWRIIRDNALFWDETLTPGTVLKVRPVPPRPTFVTHLVSSGDTLGALARRYRTTVRAIQSANSLGGSTAIRIGQQLRIPAHASG